MTDCVCYREFRKTSTYEVETRQTEEVEGRKSEESHARGNRGKDSIDLKEILISVA